LRYLNGTAVAEVVLSNASDAAFELRYNGDYTFMFSADRITVPAHGQITVQIKPGKKLRTLDLPFVVENALTAPGKYAQLTLTVAR